jgi:hypothetical protein
MINNWPSTGTHNHGYDSIHSNPTLQESQKYDRHQFCLHHAPIAIYRQGRSLLMALMADEGQSIECGLQWLSKHVDQLNMKKLTISISSSLSP